MYVACEYICLAKDIMYFFWTTYYLVVLELYNELESP